MRRLFSFILFALLVLPLRVPAALAVMEVCPTGTPCCTAPQAITDGGGCPAGMVWIGGPLGTLSSLINPLAQNGRCDVPAVCQPGERFSCADNTCFTDAAACKSTDVSINPSAACCADGDTPVFWDGQWRCYSRLNPWFTDAVSNTVYVLDQTEEGTPEDDVRVGINNDAPLHALDIIGGVCVGPALACRNTTLGIGQMHVSGDAFLGTLETDGIQANYLDVANGITGDTLTINADATLTTLAATTIDLSGLIRPNGATCTTGQVLSFNGSGAMVCSTPASGGQSFWNASGSNIHYTAGRVGVGTSSPASGLHVESAEGLRITEPNNQYNARLTFGGASSVYNSGLRTDESGNAELRLWHENANGQVILATGYNGETATSLPTDGLFVGPGNRVGVGYNAASLTGSTRLAVNGNVGIGLAAPQNTLHVEGASGLRISQSGAGNELSSNLIFGQSSAWNSGIRTYDNGFGELRLWHENANGVIALATGYNGEGSTTLPADGLFVRGNALGIGTSATLPSNTRLAVNGRVGIGNTAPDAPLHITNGTNIGLITADTSYTKLGTTASGHLLFDTNEVQSKLNGNTAGGFFINRNGGDVNIGNGVLFMADSLDFVGVGSTTPEGRLEVANGTTNEDATLFVGRATGQASIKAGDLSSFGSLILDSTAGPFAPGLLGLNYYYNGNVVLANGGGDVGIGNSDPSYRLDVRGDTFAQVARIENFNSSSTSSGLVIQIGPDDSTAMSSSNDFIRFLDGDGGFEDAIESDGAGGTRYTGNAAGTYSDSRLKTDIRPYTQDALSFVESLKPVTFRYKNGTNPSLARVGFVAQDLLGSFAQAINFGDPLPAGDPKDLPLLRLDYSQFVPVFAKAIQEQQDQIRALQKSNQELLQLLCAQEPDSTLCISLSSR